MAVTREDALRSLDIFLQDKELIQLQADAFALYLINHCERLPSVDTAYIQSAFYLWNIMLEIRVFIEVLKSTHEDYSVIDKYLTLFIVEAIKTTPVVVGAFIRESRKEAVTYLKNIDALKQELKSFKAMAKDLLAKLNLEDVHELVRNTTTAHHLDNERGVLPLSVNYLVSRGFYNEGGRFIDTKTPIVALALSNSAEALLRALAQADDIQIKGRVKKFYKEFTSEFGVGAPKHGTNPG